jgi:hypothetical protein
MTADGHNADIESFYQNVAQNFGKDFPLGPLYLGDRPSPKPMTELRAESIGSTLEYSLDRVHIVPAWFALENPFASHDSAWAMVPPGISTPRDWWPREHYAPAQPLVPLPAYQAAQLRRDSSSMLAFATALGVAQLGRRAFDTVETQLFVSTGPHAIDRVATRRTNATDRATFLSPLPDAPTVVSVEVPWDEAGHAGARTRFGLTPLPPLNTMRAGELAISDPILLTAPPEGRAAPDDAATAVRAMLGQTTLSRGTRTIGVYWETYGFNATDSVRVSVLVRREGDGTGALVTTSWAEPDPAHTARSVAAGAISIQSRSVAVEISSLREGRYVLEISVAKPGAPSVTSRRPFAVIR